MSLCTNVNPSLSTLIDINPDHKALQAVMVRLGKPDTDPTPALHLVMSSLHRYTIQAGLSSWLANHRALADAVSDMASAMYDTRPGPQITRSSRSLRLCSNAVDWLQNCEVRGDPDPGDLTIEVGNWHRDNRITMSIEYDYTKDTSANESDGDGNGTKNVTILSSHKIDSFPHGRSLEPERSYHDSKEDVQRYLLLILPSVARKARNMRMCKDCCRTLRRQMEPVYYDKATAECCPDCVTNQTAKRMCLRF